MDARQDVGRTYRLQHLSLRIVQREHVIGAATSGQRQHLFFFQRGLGQQVQKDLEHAAVGRLVDGCCHDDIAGLGHWGAGTDD